MRRPSTIGMTFGRLTVLREGSPRIRSNGQTQSRVDCVCTCGKVITTAPQNLWNGFTKSCGCLQKEYYAKPKAPHPNWKVRKDLTGMRFGRLVVVAPGPVSRGGSMSWLCKCDCGGSRTIASTSLLWGRTHSCGCYRIEVASSRLARINAVQKKEAHPCWNSKLTPEQREARRTGLGDYRRWRAKVYRRDGYSCQWCGDARGGNLIAHHLSCWVKYPRLRFIVRNGITLCKGCHHAYHKLAGPKQATKSHFNKLCTARNMVALFILLCQKKENKNGS